MYVISKIVSDRPAYAMPIIPHAEDRVTEIFRSFASATKKTMALNYLHLAHRQLKSPADRDFAVYLDSQYPTFRHEFHIPTNEGVGATDHPHPQEECIYFCGNSLGLQPIMTKFLVQAELDIWANRGVQGHFRHDKWPWVSIHETCTAESAKIVGAKVEEIAIMGSLTANLHLLMAAFYAPTKGRYKIIIEHRAFPSDHVCRPLLE
jgi:kynureninase